MNDVPGKPGTAPCGHRGVHFTANYVHCPRCDVLGAVPEHIDDPGTQPLCRSCGSSNIKAWDDEFRNLLGDTFWTCGSCGVSFYA